MAEICAEAGISAGALYRYFSSQGRHHRRHRRRQARRERRGVSCAPPRSTASIDAMCLACARLLREVRRRRRRADRGHLRRSDSRRCGGGAAARDRCAKCQDFHQKRSKPRRRAVKSTPTLDRRNGGQHLVCGARRHRSEARISARHGHGRRGLAIPRARGALSRATPMNKPDRPELFSRAEGLFKRAADAGGKRVANARATPANARGTARPASRTMTSAARRILMHDRAAAFSR